MIRVQVLTHWVRTVDGNGWPQNDPALLSDNVLAPYDSWVDVTEQPAVNLLPAPNVLILECVVSDATFAAILAHSDYGAGAVLWSEAI